MSKYKYKKEVQEAVRLASKALGLSESKFYSLSNTTFKELHDAFVQSVEVEKVSPAELLQEISTLTKANEQA